MKNKPIISSITASFLAITATAFLNENDIQKEQNFGEVKLYSTQGGKKTNPAKHADFDKSAVDVPKTGVATDVIKTAPSIKIKK